MKGITIDISQLAKVQKAMAKLKGDVPKASAAGLYAIGQRVIAKAKPVTPKKKGTLRKSGKTELPKINGNKVTCEAGFGGPASAYAAVQEQGFRRRKGSLLRRALRKLRGSGNIVVFKNYTEPGTGPHFLANAVKEIRPDAAKIFQRAFMRVFNRSARGA